MSGLRLKAGGPDLTEVVIAEVNPDTPASAAHLRPGDRIVAIEGREDFSPWDAQRALSAAPGRMVWLRIQNHDAQRDVSSSLKRFV
ncbi:MAG TPA: PDZ domain-containing protein [Verrucomicrobiae bacterium]|nr:PDZ domain-containing protein [Verrucomicrobiae bacterium]